MAFQQILPSHFFIDILIFQRNIKTYILLAVVHTQVVASPNVYNQLKSQLMMSKKVPNLRFLISIGFLLIFYIVGVFLLLKSNDKDTIITYTPYILLVTLALLLLNHSKWSKKIVFSLLIIFSLGFLVEVLGVQTGFPFGSYHYSEILGIQLFNTPLVMGVNWVLLVYAGTMLFQPLAWPNYLKSIVTGLMLVVLDIFLEPFAIRWNLWQWIETVPPLQNYISWAFIAMLLTYILNSCLEKSMRNPIAGYILIIQFVFFVLLSN